MIAFVRSVLKRFKNNFHKKKSSFDLGERTGLVGKALANTSNH